MTGPIRLIVTGSRSCTPLQARFVRAALARNFFNGIIAERGLVVVEGECPYGGVDRVAREWAESLDNLGVTVEPHPADWDTYGAAAGPRRNREMAAAGADMCVGFPRGKSSKGTWGMLQEAAAAGIACRVYPLPDV